MSTLLYPNLAAMIYRIVAKMGRVDGRTRLMKLVYLSEVEAARELGRSITEAKFYSYTHGPFAREVLDTVREMRGFWIEETRTSNSLGSDSYVYFLSRFPAEPLVLEDEAAACIVDRVAEEWGNKPLNELLAYVYKNEPFASTAPGHDIDFTSLYSQQAIAA